MIDHLGMPVSDLARATEFYQKARSSRSVTASSCRCRRQRPAMAPAVGFGPPGRAADFQNGKPSFWIGEGERPGGLIHVAFVAPSRASADAFYRAALAADGKDNGPSGLRPHYHANYYGAFVLDRDGNNIEAVCHAPRSSSEAVAHQKSAQVGKR